MFNMSHHHIGRLVALFVMTFSGSLSAQDDFERPPIEYSTSQPDNCVSRLQERLDNGEISLTHDGTHGYLKAALEALGVPIESQVLVFSKTSLQTRYISPRTPRAIYFNDEVYVGFCQSGDVMEVSAVDPQLGTVYYTLNQKDPDSPPRFERRGDTCLVCHASSRTEGIPGHLVRSLAVDESGYPLLSMGSRTVDHTTPFDQRWGGWYVTGQHGSQTHLGNRISREGESSQPVADPDAQNITSLADRFNVDRYLSPHSDIVALMVLEHQVLVHNRITNANFTTRQALAYNQMMIEALEYSPETRLDSTTRRIQGAGDELVDALLLVGEAPLTAAVQGTSGYTEQFAKTGPRDSQGRSLRELDLQRRLLRYPCSYLIYSDAFAALPQEMRDYVWQRMGEILSGDDASPKYAHLTSEDREAIIEILRETMPGLPEHWGGKQAISLSQ